MINANSFTLKKCSSDEQEEIGQFILSTWEIIQFECVHIISSKWIYLNTLFAFKFCSSPWPQKKKITKNVMNVCACSISFLCHCNEHISKWNAYFKRCKNNFNCDEGFWPLPFISLSTVHSMGWYTYSDAQMKTEWCNQFKYNDPVCYLLCVVRCCISTFP